MAFSRAMRGLLFGVTADDPATLGAVVATLVGAFGRDRRLVEPAAAVVVEWEQQLHEMHVVHRRRLAAALLVASIVGASGLRSSIAARSGRSDRPAQLADRDDVRAVNVSSDVRWLEHLAASDAPSRDAESPSKTVRVAAYARLGALGTPESLAAIDRVERTLAAVPVTPPTVRLDTWPTISWHMPDDAVEELATRAPPRGGVTYAVVPATLLGGEDYFLLSSRTPRDVASWSRPKLIAPVGQGGGDEKRTLSWSGARALMLTAGSRTLGIDIDAVERDSDGDGWTDLEEARLGTNPRNPDSDGDGIPDGRDVCPLFARPASEVDESAIILQKAVFAAFAVTGSRQLLYVIPGTPRVHVTGYGGPILFDRPTPADGDGAGGTWVQWKIERRSASDALVQVSDWEGMLAAGGQDVMLKKIDTRWVVVSVRPTWIS